MCTSGYAWVYMLANETTLVRARRDSALRPPNMAQTDPRFSAYKIYSTANSHLHRRSSDSHRADRDAWFKALTETLIVMAAHGALKDCIVIASPGAVLNRIVSQQSRMLRAAHFGAILSYCSESNWRLFIHALMSRHFPPTLQPQRHSPRSTFNNSSSKDRASFESADTIKDGKNTLDLTQRLERKLAEYNASDNVFKRWILEVTSWMISAACLCAVVGIYLRINGKEMVESEGLLTWVNVLGKIASAALIVPTSEALGQLKWNWFHKSRAMWDFEIFDKASRGPWGAIMLLFRTRGRSLAALGALLIVLLLAIDTFLQQVVEYPDRWQLRTDQISAIPRVVRYDPDVSLEYFQGGEAGTYDQALLPIAKNFFYKNGTRPTPFGNGTRPDIPLSCPTSRCTWPLYETLAVCSKCEEVSTHLDIVQTCLNTSIDWTTTWHGPITTEPIPNGTVCGHFLNATSTKPILLSGHVVSTQGNATTTGEVLLTRAIPLTDFHTKQPFYGDGSVQFKDIRNPILDALVASAGGDAESVRRGTKPSVHECVLSWCVQTVNSSYEWGAYSEEIVSQYWHLSSGSTPWPWQYSNIDVDTMDFIYKENITLQPDQPAVSLGRTRYSPSYEVANTTVFSAMAVFDDFFPSYYTIRNGSTIPLLRYKNYFNGPWTRALKGNNWQSPNNLTRYMERFAESFTNSMRSSDSKEMVLGDAYETTKFVSVHWEWLSFPFALLVLSLAFLVSTMIKTSKDTATGTWKTSAMPTLIYGLPEEARGKLAPGSDWNRTQGHSRKVRIRLMPTMGWRVSGQEFLRSPLLPVNKNQPLPGWI